MNIHPGQLLSNVRIAWHTKTRAQALEPQQFALQVAQRCPSVLRSLLKTALRLNPTSRFKATSRLRTKRRLAYLNQNLQLLHELTRTAANLKWSTKEEQTWADLAMYFGDTSLATKITNRISTETLARDLYRKGELSAAIHLLADGNLQNSRVLKIINAELQALQAGWKLQTSKTLKLSAKSRQPSELRVLHMLTNSLPLTVSGYSTRSHEMLRSQKRAGVEVYALTRLNYPASIGAVTAPRTVSVDGITYRRLVGAKSQAQLDTWYIAHQYREAVKHIKTFEPSVLHTTTEYHKALSVDAAARRFNLPWVYEIRGLREDSWVASLEGAEQQLLAANSELYRLWQNKETQMCERANAVVTLNNAMRAELIERGIPAEKIYVVPNAVDADLFDKPEHSPDQARQALKLPEADAYLGTVSSLVDYEGIETLLHTIKQLRQEGRDVRGLIVGEGAARAELQREAVELGINDHVTFTGRINTDRVWQYYQALDLFVLPRKDLRVCQLVTPIKPMPALAFGRPLIVSDVAALTEISSAVGAGLAAEAGNYLAFADACAQLLDNPDEYARCSEAAKNYAKTHTWTQNEKKYRELYTRLVEEQITNQDRE